MPDYQNICYTCSHLIMVSFIPHVSSSPQVDTQCMKNIRACTMGAVVECGMYSPVSDITQHGEIKESNLPIHTQLPPTTSSPPIIPRGIKTETLLDFPKEIPVEWEAGELGPIRGDQDEIPDEYNEEDWG